MKMLQAFETIDGCDGGSVSYRASDSDREVSEEDDGDEGSSTESQRSSSHDDDFISEDEDLAENRQIEQHSGLEALLSNLNLPL